MNFTISCPSCRRTLRVPDNLLGQAVKCPSCDHQFTAPEQIEDEPAPRPAADRPSREDAREDDPRPSKRLAPADEYDEDYEEMPRRRRSRSGEKPGKVQAIAIMILIGGIIACAKIAVWDLWLGIASAGICCVPGIYSLVLGIKAIVKGSQLLSANDYKQPPPTGIAVMMIVNIISFDVINLTMGILILVFLNDPEVREYYRG